MPSADFVSKAHHNENYKAEDKRKDQKNVRQCSNVIQL